MYCFPLAPYLMAQIISLRLIKWGVFIIVCKIWRIVIGDVTKLVKNTPKKDGTNDDTWKFVDDDNTDLAKEDTKFIEWPELRQQKSSNYNLVG